MSKTAVTTTRRSTSAVYGRRPTNARTIDGPAVQTGSDGRLTVALDVRAEHLLLANVEGAICGVYVVTNTLTQAGTPLAVTLEGPWGAPLSLRGKVAWAVATPRESMRQRPGMGIRLDVTAAHRALLAKAIILRAPVSWPEGIQ